MTPEEAKGRILSLACEIALRTPERPNASAFRAGVPWEIILELRETLTFAGYDYPTLRARYRQIKAEMQAERIAAAPPPA